MKPTDIYKIRSAVEPRISPDGSSVAFVVSGLNEDRNDYTGQIWIARKPGNEARPLTTGEHRDSKPRWSPDGTRLAFVSHREDKGSQVFVLPLEGGEARRVCNFPEEVEELAWSPRGDRIAMLVRDQNKDLYEKEKPKDQPPRRVDQLNYRLDTVGWTIDRPRHLFVIDIEAQKEPRQLTSGRRESSGLAWSPDGSKIAFVSARHDTWEVDRCNDIFTVSVDEEKIEQLTTTDGSHSFPSWSPDGSMIAFGLNPDPTNSPRHGRIAVFELNAGTKRVLTEDLDRNCTPFFGAREPVWSREDIYFLVEDHGNQHLYRVPAREEGKPEHIAGEENQIIAFDVANDVVALSVTSSNTLPSIKWGGHSKPVADFTREFASETQISAPVRFTATSRDGSEVEAWCIPPASLREGEKYPTLLNIHGGPFTQYGNRFFDEFQVYSGAGYAILFCNPRGSCGYSEEWGRAIRGPKAEDPGSGWGGVDYEDLMAVVDGGIEAFSFIDPNNLGVIGGSYGGFMTSWMIGHTNRFKAAVSERAVNNHLTMCWTSDLGPYFRSWYGPMYLDDPEEYLRMSPITYVKDIVTPVLILHSENDLRCPISQGEELFTALRVLGKEVEFVRFPGESHELSRSGAPKHRVQRFEIILEFFDRHLKDTAGTNPT